ncbi:ABC transporter permease [Agrobacterium vitis]|uniref:ABC transporter permease n=1 Tax=Agrobacterium vitis TaxID=373 RepID=UPI001F3370B5|nr:ABC transporter permease [Agrobacterium vitis]
MAEQNMSQATARSFDESQRAESDRPDEPTPGPWIQASRKLVRDPSAMAALAVLIFIVFTALLAPLYAQQIAKTDPFRSNLDAEIMSNGETIPVLEPSTEGLGIGMTPIGPTWRMNAYFLGSDMQGRDVMARILYGGRATLFISSVATVITLIIATVVGVCAGFFGGWIDQILSSLLDILWAFPIYLLAISLSIVLLTAHIEIGPFVIESGSLAIPIVITGIIYVPYIARPIRGQVLSLRHSEFVLAAIGLGVPSYRILARDILPNVMNALIVYVPLMVALNITTETALSFLSLGVQPPYASWGTIIRDGQSLIYNRPWVSIAPGLAVIATIVALNILGDGVRDAFDPRAKLRA